jgi:hypothetical protein
MLVVRQEVAEHTQVIVLPPKHLIMASTPPSTVAPSTSSRIEDARPDFPGHQHPDSPEPGSVSSHNDDQKSVAFAHKEAPTRKLEQEHTAIEEAAAAAEQYTPTIVPSPPRPPPLPPPTRDEVLRSLRALQAAEDLRFQEVGFCFVFLVFCFVL